jgi:hypothetical protein
MVRLPTLWELICRSGLQRCAADRLIPVILPGLPVQSTRGVIPLHTTTRTTPDCPGTYRATSKDPRQGTILRPGGSNVQNAESNSARARRAIVAIFQDPRKRSDVSRFFSEAKGEFQ